MKHFLNIADFSPELLWGFLRRAKTLKDEFKRGGNQPRLQGKVLGMIFQKPSLRTRVSFELGMLHLGGHAVYISPHEIGLGERESIPDVARVMSGYVDGLMARVFAHDHLLQLAQYSQVPVINGLSDANHPCQALTDIFTIWEHFGYLEGLTMAYVGDGNNMAASLMMIASKLGVNFCAASPQGYVLPAETVAQAQEFATESHVNLAITESPFEAVRDVDIIYTDTWVSMGQEEERTHRLQLFPPYQVNKKLVEAAKPSAVVMHCLPAHRGEEITDEVADGEQSIIFQQAENRLHTQKAILAILLG